MTRVVVIGGGVIGVTAGAAMARRGLNVTVLERAEILGGGTTARNGGQLSYSYTDALAAPAILRDLPGLLAGLDPAFRVRVRLTPQFLAWTMRFLANCTASRFTENTLAVLRLALWSRSALMQLTRRFPELAFNHGTSGKLLLYDDAAKLQRTTASIQLKNQFGCEQRVLSRDEMLAIEPALSGSGRPFVGAIYSPLDEAGDPQAFTQALAAIAARDFGMNIMPRTVADRFIVERDRIRAVETSRGRIEADVFVLSAGTDVPALARTAGVRVPVAPMKGYSITLPATKHAPVISITDTRAKIVFCRLGGQLRIAGMAELGRVDTSIDAHRIGTLLNAARRCLPMAAHWQEDPQPWAGLRPMTPDCRPIIGPTPIANLFLNCGHGMLGWTLACGSAELTAGCVAGETPAERSFATADDFRLSRFYAGAVARARNCPGATPNSW
jgi:D-amino-acid dehydrogenase